jgi:hypothetical protein
MLSEINQAQKDNYTNIRCFHSCEIQTSKKKKSHDCKIVLVLGGEAGRGNNQRWKGEESDEGWNVTDVWGVCVGK